MRIPFFTKRRELLQQLYHAKQENDILTRQLGNRLGLNFPTIPAIYDRCDALQRLAVERDQMRMAINTIDDDDIESMGEAGQGSFQHIRALIG